MQEPETNATKDKIDLLKHMELIQRQEARVYDERQYNIFKWSSSILLAVMGALLIIEPSESVVWGSYGLTGKVIASLVILLFVGFSIQWQIRNRKQYAENGAVVQRIDELLHFYEKGFFDPDGEVAIFPERWKHSPTRGEINLVNRLKSLNYASATAILGLMTLVVIWIV